ncbi:unnamed protein product [Polarella glacialis]|uniref:Uncharacterized protein n=1 Tax=Polarella glacialis TaxID=89957 RepID=A0A813EJ26_POLGL|nr:unnamed protein product [Polarella glacialis]
MKKKKKQKKNDNNDNNNSNNQQQQQQRQQQQQEQQQQQQQLQQPYQDQASEKLVLSQVLSMVVGSKVIMLLWVWGRLKRMNSFRQQKLFQGSRVTLHSPTTHLRSAT